MSKKKEDRFERIAQRIAEEAIRYDSELPLDIAETASILRAEFGEKTVLPPPPTVEEFDEHKPHTFQDWSDHNFRIIKGSKSTGRNEENKATFTRNQVLLIEDRVVASYDDEDDWIAMGAMDRSDCY